MPMSTSEVLQQELGEQRRTVDFDTFDIQLQELLRMLSDGQISVAPVYQRHFRWDDERCSELIESLMLGIPIPNLFMATNPDNTWEVVDGVQRLSAVVKFAGDDALRSKHNLAGALKLEGLQKLNKFNGMRFDDFPPHIQQHLRTRPLKVVTLNDKSDQVVRIDLFERLNTGGIELTQQEIRDCVFHGSFADKLDELGDVRDFHMVVRLTGKQERDGTRRSAFSGFLRFWIDTSSLSIALRTSSMTICETRANHLIMKPASVSSEVSFGSLRRRFLMALCGPAGRVGRLSIFMKEWLSGQL